MTRDPQAQSAPKAETPIMDSVQEDAQMLPSVRAIAQRYFDVGCQLERETVSLAAENAAMRAALEACLELSSRIIDGSDFDKFDEWEATARRALGKGEA